MVAGGRSIAFELSDRTPNALLLDFFDCFLQQCGIYRKVLQHTQFDAHGVNSQRLPCGKLLQKFEHLLARIFLVRVGYVDSIQQQHI